jgi:hypothetical protein
VKAAHIIPSFLARSIRDGRLCVQVNCYTARLVVGDADWIIPLYGLHSPIIPPPVEWAASKSTVGEWVRFDVMPSLFLPMGMIAELRPVNYEILRSLAFLETTASKEETYWYLTATPELLTAAGEAFRRSCEPGGNS